MALINDKLRVNDDFFIWAETSHSRVKLSALPSASTTATIPLATRHTSAIGVIVQNDKRHFPLRKSSAS